MNTLKPWARVSLTTCPCVRGAMNWTGYLPQHSASGRGREKPKLKLPFEVAGQLASRIRRLIGGVHVFQVC